MRTYVIWFMVMGMGIFLSAWACEFVTKKKGFLLGPALLFGCISFCTYAVCFGPGANIPASAFMAGILLSFIVWLIARPLAYFFLLRKMKK